MRVKCTLACDEKAALMDSGTPPPLLSSFAQPRPLRQSDKWRASRRIIIQRRSSARQTRTAPPPPAPSSSWSRPPSPQGPLPAFSTPSDAAPLEATQRDAGVWQRRGGSVGMLSVFSVSIILKAAGSAAVSAVGTAPRAFACVHA